MKWWAINWLKLTKISNMHKNLKKKLDFKVNVMYI